MLSPRCRIYPSEAFRFSSDVVQPGDCFPGLAKEKTMSRLGILIVDDDPRWREELVSLLSEANYDVEEASSLQDAYEKLLHTAYAVIIIDLDLESEETGDPRRFEGFGLLDGRSFLEELPQRQGKAIVLSAYGGIEPMRQAFKRGAYDFVLKQEVDGKRFLGLVREAAELWEPRHTEETQRDLTSEEKKEYKRVTWQFMRGKPVRYEVPSDAVNPWSARSEAPEMDVGDANHS